MERQVGEVFLYKGKKYQVVLEHVKVVLLIMEQLV